ncbi:MAG: hypothetical protein V2A65_07245 [Candidatus Omnitrophota bacterium]
MEKEELIRQLDDFDVSQRYSALQSLKAMSDRGEIPVQTNRGWLNLHGHTFFSFSAYGFSPSHFLWEAFCRGLDMAGIVDFDVLDGLEETFTSAEILGIKTEVGFETRVFVGEYADKVINSPGEPGVFYIMGTGFFSQPERGSRAAAILDSLKKRAQARNRLIVERVNGFLTPVTINYKTDVLPLTPKGNATERHILTAYYQRAVELFPGLEKRIGFWAEVLKVPEEELKNKIEQPHSFQELARMKLMKGKGVGYIKPETDTFPLLEEVVEMVQLTGAVPTATFNDGTSAGEKNIEETLAFLKDKGMPLVNIIPERFWNIKDPAEKALKSANLKSLMTAARNLKILVVVGTEMNRYGQPLVDNFETPELKDYLDDFQQAGRFLWEYTQQNLRKRNK